MPFAPIGSEKYGWKNIFAVIDFAKAEAAGLFFLVDILLFFCIVLFKKTNLEFL